MNNIFMNSENSKTSDPQRLLLNLTDKKPWEEKINSLLYQILEFTIHKKIFKKSYQNNKFKTSAPT